MTFIDHYDEFYVNLLHLTRCLRVLRDAAASGAAITAVACSARGLWLEQ